MSEQPVHPQPAAWAVLKAKSLLQDIGLYPTEPDRSVYVAGFLQAAWDDGNSIKRDRLSPPSVECAEALVVFISNLDAEGKAEQIAAAIDRAVSDERYACWRAVAQSNPTPKESGTLAGYLIGNALDAITARKRAAGSGEQP